MRDPVTWVILDVNYLAYRAFYAHSNLTYEDRPSGVLYGLFRDVRTFTDRYATDQIIFCFDHGINVRKKVYRNYKANREVDDPLLKKSLEQMRKQLHNFKYHLLKHIGYRNVFFQDGYEADDIIASVVMNLPRQDEAVIISADTDLFQVLTNKVRQFSPREKVTYDEDKIRFLHGIGPDKFAQAKAIAGCSTDNVIGLHNVGIKKAAEFISGKMNDNSATAKKIADFIGSERYDLNYKLISLPYSGTKDYVAVLEDPVSERRWNEVMREFGMKSLRR